MLLMSSKPLIPSFLIFCSKLRKNATSKADAELSQGLFVEFYMPGQSPPWSCYLFFLKGSPRGPLVLVQNPHSLKYVAGVHTAAAHLQDQCRFT